MFGECIAGRCQPTGSGGSAGTAGSAGGGSGGTAGLTFDAGATGGTSGDCDVGVACGARCCAAGDVCVEDLCAPSEGACVSSEECQNDTYCRDGHCIPFGVPSGHDHNASCTVSIDIGAIEPQVQCAWTGPPPGDPFPDHIHVMSTPMVVDFNFDGDPNTLRPSIAFVSFPTVGSYHAPGVLRVIDGATCEQQFTFPEQLMSPSGVALGDLDGDGRAEIVAPGHQGGLHAFRYDAAAGTFSQLWRSGSCSIPGGPPDVPDNTGGTDKWSGPSIHDLDDDGVPEILYGGVVYDADGCLVSSDLGFLAYSVGVVPVVADVDHDGGVELVTGNAIYGWDTASRTWVVEPYFSGALTAGQVAVAELGNFPLAAFGGEDRPEVVVVSDGTIRVQTLEGTVVFGPFAVPGGGGGAPTIADFDGDGRREFATAGAGQYVVFDFDCLSGGDPAGCNGQARTDGVLWSQSSQDMSSRVTGSSVFDFDADGSAEAVYADECFLRIYDGKTGTVLYSASRSSGTTYENPVIVDVDGDFHTEIVSSVNDYGNISCPATDPLMPSTSYERSRGVVVLRDVMDRWAASRPVWNQHAYAVTHVGDRGEIPMTSAVQRNWQQADLNNFRQNVQGDLEALGIPDLTARGAPFTCDRGVATLSASICNRGTLPIGVGAPVRFHAGSATGSVLCETSISATVGVGACIEVSCTAPVSSDPTDVYVVADPEGTTEECLEGNNIGVLRGVRCDAGPA